MKQSPDEVGEHKYKIEICHRSTSSTCTTFIYNSKTDQLKLKSSGPCTKTEWDAMRRFIVDMVIEHNPCQGLVNSTYIFGVKTVSENPKPKTKEKYYTQIAEWDGETNRQTEYEHVRDIMMVATQNGASTPCSFLLGCDRDFKANPAYYIDVICSKTGGGGAPLIKTMTKHFNDRPVQLSAVITVLAYYPTKFQFLFGKTCQEAAALEPIFRDFLINKNLLKLDPENYKNFSKETNTALQELIDRQVYNDVHSPDCHPGMKVADFIENSCYNEGFPQIRCQENLKK